MRRTLDLSTDKDFGSSYVHLKANLVSLDSVMCSFDVDEFLSFCEQGRRKEEEGDLKEACSLYGKAAELYKGDFLEEDLYVPWIDLKRQKIKQEFIDLLCRMADLYERLGRSRKSIQCCRKVIQTDPSFEEAYQRLMSIYLGLGKKNEAMKTYEICRKALREGLDTDPDEITTSLYRTALGR